MDKIETIIKLTSEHFGIPKSKIKMPDSIEGARKKEIVRARHSAMVLAVENNKQLTFKEIIASFGNRDRSSIYHAQQAIQDQIDTNSEFRKSFNELSAKVDLKLNPTRIIEERFEEFKYAFV